MPRTARAVLARGFTVIKGLNTQPKFQTSGTNTQCKFQTSLQYAKMNIIPLATAKIPQFTYGTSRLLRDITAKAFGTLGARALVSFIKADGEEDSAEYKRMMELLQQAIDMVPVAEIKELCAGLNIPSTSFVMFIKNFNGPNVEEIISKIQNIPGVKEIHEFLEAKGIKVNIRVVAMFIIWIATGMFSP